MSNQSTRFLSEENFTIDEAGKRGVLKLEGELTMEQAVDIKETLLSALVQVEHLSLNLEEGTVFDLSFVQLLYSAYQTALSMNKSLTLRGACPADLKQIVKESGYNQHQWLPI
ncbi:MAG: STAS domain-containing protein [SAR324 cluster bacterium]|nr:STAS domain-containing protein [SAR324 cluster bacterium]